jgi:hypothetical protein
MTFSNPVNGLPLDETTRTTLVAKNKVLSRIKQIYNKSGVPNTTINILLDKLCDELDRIKLDTYDPPTYCAAICGARIILGVPAAKLASSRGPEDPHEAPHGNDGRGTSGMVSQAAGLLGQSSNPHLLPKRRGRKKVVGTEGATPGHELV